ASAHRSRASCCTGQAANDGLIRLLARNRSPHGTRKTQLRVPVYLRCYDPRMSYQDLTSRDAVLSAIREFDELGREEFLAKYGFGEARQYFLFHKGQQYDSKAIVGAAHAYQFPEQGPLTPADFSGGDATVRAKLEDLGFEVTRVDDSEMMRPMYPTDALARVIGEGPLDREEVVRRFWAYV